MNFAASQAHERMKGARARLLDLSREVEEALRQARTHNDPNLSAEGVRNARRDIEDRARQTYGPRVESAAGEIARDVDTVRAWLDDTRPAIGSDSVAWQRAQIKWDQVRTRLAAGMSLQAIVGSVVDAETLLAIREWAPAWLEAEHFRASGGSQTARYRPPDLSWIERAVDGRLADVVGGEFADALAAAVDAEAIGAGVKPATDGLAVQIAGGHADGLYAAVGGRMLEGATRADYAGQPPEEPTAA